LKSKLNRRKNNISMLEVENFNLIKAQKKNNVKERGLNAKQRTKRVNNIY
jgi:hypothetical protein